MIPLLPLFAFLLVVLPGKLLPLLPGSASDAASLLVDTLFRLAVIALATALLLYVERVEAGRHPDSR